MENIVLPTKHFVDSQGNYLGAFTGIQRDGGQDEMGRPRPPIIEEPGPTVQNAVEVPSPPAHGRDMWDGSAWVPHVPPGLDVDAELAKKENALLRAIAELVPGGKAALKAKVTEQRGQSA